MSEQGWKPDGSEMLCEEMNQTPPPQMTVSVQDQ